MTDTPTPSSALVAKSVTVTFPNATITVQVGVLDDYSADEVLVAAAQRIARQFSDPGRIERRATDVAIDGIALEF
jgi:hypothetical protein